MHFESALHLCYNSSMEWGILGHQWAVDLLAQHAAHDGLRHAYLFTGPPGIGRRTLALRLAQAVNCLKPPLPGQPCGACPACVRLSKMQHPDLTVTQAEQTGGTLKVEQVRELQRSLSLAPYEARYRVALLLRFEEANPSAANALLKTLEEPPAQVLLLLTAESLESLLPTIVSRCESIRLRPLPLQDVAAGLEQRWGIPREQALLLAHLSGGRPGTAVRMHEHPEVLEARQTWLNDLASLMHAARVERFAYAQAAVKAAAEGKDSLRQCLMVWISFWHDVIYQACGSAAPLTNLDWAAQANEWGEIFGLARSRAALERIEHTLTLIDANVHPRLALETLFLDLPRLP